MTSRYTSYRNLGLTPSWGDSSYYVSPTTTTSTTSTLPSEVVSLEDYTPDYSGAGSTSTGNTGNSNLSASQALSQLGSFAMNTSKGALSGLSLMSGNVLAAPTLYSAWGNLTNNNPYAEPGWFGKTLDDWTGTTPTYGYGSYNQNPSTADLGLNDVGWGSFGASGLGGTTGTSAVSSQGYMSENPGEYQGGLSSLGENNTAGQDWNGVDWGDTSGSGEDSDTSGPTSDYGYSSGSDDGDDSTSSGDW